MSNLNFIMKKLIVLASLIFFLGCAGQGELLNREEVAEVFENTLETGVTSLDFETYNGYIEIRFWDNEGYKIEVEKWARAATSAEAKEKAENINVDVSVKGETLEVTVEQERNAGADIVVYLPQRSFDMVDISTSNGLIKIEEMTASNVTLITSNGLIEAYITADSIRVDTSNGQVSGFFQGNTADIETSNGQVNIRCGDSGQYAIRTSNGRITIITGLQGAFDITTSNGSIDITVLGDFSFDLSSSNASIVVSADGVTYTVETNTHKKGSTATAAPVSITASTSNGSITVRKE
jgi:DUF4097 and DUF4098 domain-containing protein YvlB